MPVTCYFSNMSSLLLIVPLPVLGYGWTQNGQSEPGEVSGLSPRNMQPWQ